MDFSSTFPHDFNGVHIHFVGIKGTGMAALVELLHRRGAVITGSDVSERFYTDEVLEKIGIHALPFDSKNITDKIQFVVHSSAYSVGKNPDLIEAEKRGLPILLYTEALGALSAAAYSAGVCGVHGKTTTTGLCGTILNGINLPAQILAGSVISSFGDSCTVTTKSFAASQKHYFVAETCEYQRHFMDFHPRKIIMTSVESDHQDYYPTFEDIQKAFVDYACLLPKNGDLIYCADDKGAVDTVKLILEKRPDIKLIPYGEKAAGDFKLTFGRVESGRQYFSVGNFGEFALCVPGEHNVRNATAAIALTLAFLKDDGIDAEEKIPEIKKSLLDFAGGKRRSEIVGRAKSKNGDEVIFIDDYGHHPTAIKTTLKGYRDFYKKHRIIVDFMSHTYTRTQALLEEFASSFASADDVIINKIYGSAREDASAATVTGEILAEHAKKYHKSVFYERNFDDAAQKGLELLSGSLDKSKYPDGWIFVTMGAGDNWKVGKKILEELTK